MVNRISDGYMELEIELEIAILKDGDYFVAYCPALELSAYGDTEEAAKESFNVEVSIFLEETRKRGTLERYLLKNGWTLQSQNYKPPETVKKLDLLAKSQNPVIRQINQNILIPACC